MDIQITITQANQAVQHIDVARTWGGSPAKHTVQAGQKISLKVNGVPLTGAELQQLPAPAPGGTKTSAAIQKYTLSRAGQDLQVLLTDAATGSQGEAVVELTGFFNSPDIQLSGSAWNWTADMPLQASAEGVSVSLTPAANSAAASVASSTVSADMAAGLVGSGMGMGSSSLALLALPALGGAGGGGGNTIISADTTQKTDTQNNNNNNTNNTNNTNNNTDTSAADAAAAAAAALAAALNKIEAYNNGNGVTPAPLTVADYQAAGVTGVTADNLAAVNAQVLAANPGGADTPPEIQALVQAANEAAAQAAAEAAAQAAAEAAVQAALEAALAKVEAFNNGNGTTPAPLTVADYEAAGVTGVTADNLAAVNAQVLAQTEGGADSVAEIQALVTSGDAALAKVEAFNNGNGVTPSALTIADYEAAGVTGVTADNLASVNAQVLAQTEGGADSVAEIQALVTSGDAALAKVEAFNNGNGVTPSALTIADYEAAGVTGVTADNLAAVNAQVLAQTEGGADSVAEIQALVTSGDAALAKIEAFNNGNGTNPAPLTIADYEAAGITGVTADNLAAVNAQVLAQTEGGADTVAEIQALVTSGDAALAKVEAFNNGNGTSPAPLTIADYEAAGVTGVTADNLVAVNAQVLAQTEGGADSVAEIQALVTAGDSALAKVEAFNNGNGTTPAPLTVADYEAAGITGVSADNLAAVNAQVLAQTEGGADSVAEIQALVTAGDAALAKVEAFNNGNGVTPAALTLADYEAAGVTGVTADNLAAVNTQVLAASVGGADTVAEIQNRVSVANAALAKIEAYNNGNGVTPTALTIADFSAAGITGVTNANLSTVNQMVLEQSTDGADSVPEVQALVDGAFDYARNRIASYAESNSGSAPLASDYSTLGISGIGGANQPSVAMINEALASTEIVQTEADSASEVQAIVDAYQVVMNNAAAVDAAAAGLIANATQAQYQNMGVSGIDSAAAEKLMGQVIDNKASADVGTVAEVQALASTVHSIMLQAAGTAQTVSQAAFEALGITSLTTARTSALLGSIAATADDGSGVDTVQKIQALLDTTAPTAPSVAIASGTDMVNNTLSTSDVLSLSVSYNEAVQVNVPTGASAPTLALDVGGSTVQAIYDSGSGSNTLIFNYTIASGLTDTNGISIASNGINLHGSSITDLADNTAPVTHTAVADNASYKVDSVAPTLSSSTPADNATAFKNTDNLSFTFNENIALGSGRITLKDLTTSINYYFEVNNNANQLSISGNTLTLNPTNDLIAGHNYAVQIDSGAITDTAGNAFAGISNDTTLNFSAIYSPAGQSVISMGAWGGQLINPVKVEGNWYYVWDRDSSGVMDYNDRMYMTTLEQYFFGTPSGMSESNRSATVNGFQIMLPTLGANPGAPGGFYYGTTVSSGSVNNPTYNDMLAIWDAHNGSGTGQMGSGVPSGWNFFYYWTATPSGSNYETLYLGNGGEGSAAPNAGWYNVAFQVL